MPRKTRNDDQDRRLWARVHVPADLWDVLTVIAAGRRLPVNEAHQIILESIQRGLPDEYERATEMLAKFNHVGEKPPD